jgi:hypothetical protein
MIYDNCGNGALKGELNGDGYGLGLWYWSSVRSPGKRSDVHAYRFLDGGNEDPRPGGFLVAQQLAYMLLVQALRLHLAEGLRGGAGWFFALSDKQTRHLTLTTTSCRYIHQNRGWNALSHCGLTCAL